MATNPYFKEYIGEQTLLDDLTVETIRVMGRDMIYLPREYLNRDVIFGEDPTSRFKKGYIIEMYIQNVTSFGGQVPIINKFGINITDRVTLQVAKTRFTDEIVKRHADIKAPREGDLVFFPFNNSLFEINYVEDKIPFFQHGILTTYTLTCELFTYSYENLDTGITEVDIIEDERRYNFLRVSLIQPGLNSSANFIKGEKLYQVSGVTGSDAKYDDATATAHVVDAVGNIVLLRNITGSFVDDPSQTIKGLTSNNEFYINGITLTDIVQLVDPAFNNDELENDYYNNAYQKLNFSKDNPFSEECS
jgi:hypothetical protein